MNWADTINGTFETCGGLVILLLNIRCTYRDKQVRGINPWATCFFASWSLWNIILYPAIGMWCSFFGGLFLCLTNFIWFCQLYYYARKEDNVGTAQPAL